MSSSLFESHPHRIQFIYAFLRLLFAGLGIFNINLALEYDLRTKRQFYGNKGNLQYIRILIFHSSCGMQMKLWNICYRLIKIKKSLHKSTNYNNCPDESYPW